MCTEIEHILWIGGDTLTSHLFEEARFLSFLSNTVSQRLEPDLLRLQTLQTTAVICRISEEAHNKFHENGGLINVMEVICENDVEMVCAELHGLFSLDNDHDDGGGDGDGCDVIDIRNDGLHTRSFGCALPM